MIGHWHPLYHLVRGEVYTKAPLSLLRGDCGDGGVAYVSIISDPSLAFREPDVGQA